MKDDPNGESWVQWSENPLGAEPPPAPRAGRDATLRTIAFTAFVLGLALGLTLASMVQLGMAR
jgi:hypothetical protein